MKNILSAMSSTNPNFRQTFSHRGLNEQTNDETPSTVPSTATEVKEVLPSQIRAISPFVDRLVLVLKPFIEKSKSVVGAEEDIETALREALANAIIHGNRQDPQKSVYVNIICKTGEISITVRDEGQGFDASAVADPTAQEKLKLNHGRGIYLMRALMDEVSFARNGTVVRMRKILNGNIKTL
jgi:serine/threonine-protein kinase RsbW